MKKRKWLWLELLVVLVCFVLTMVLVWGGVSLWLWFASPSQ
jgi:hypothetical protein